MRIETPSTGVVDDLADMWVELAADQRRHGSHLVADGNRASIRSAIGRHVVSSRVRVAREEGRLVGFVMFTVESDSLERTVSRGLIENLYVVPDRRREGIGTKLLERAENALEDSGVETIALDVLAGNDSARAFYAETGYEPHRLTVEKPIESDTHSKGDD
ncbi:GNAT family N-acetyltransferase [Halorhabdus amylolytica]|uniref:GNAT family N-acetyltransferase n=1 Tax=Halorhabdus amylolytica TaxID=2559573 RepID=UPI0020C04FF6|nr:GNAT family N-acetyltransferase [Halorhabdus amylolytica]